jgi:hypothetical protein
MYVAKPLTDCWKECPTTDTSLESVLEDWGRTQETADQEFLHSLGVCM